MGNALHVAWNSVQAIELLVKTNASPIEFWVVGVEFDHAAQQSQLPIDWRRGAVIRALPVRSNRSFP